MNDLFDRGIEEIISQTELSTAMQAEKKLRIKLGVDPSSPDIHLGHAVVLRKLRQFQDMGHTIIFLIGDYTARIGDPSGKKKTRPVLSEKEIVANAQTYLDQVGKILDLDKVEVRRNSEWWNKMNFGELLKLASNFTVAQIIEREDFKTRLNDGIDVALHEVLYPVMQAYDSVMLEADVEFGGTDQRFNMLAGRALQKKLGQRPQQIVMCKLLVGTDGVQKMSKSLGNYVGIDDSPSDMFGKIMSIPDNLIGPYYDLCTDIAEDVIKQTVTDIANGANPRDTKASLAREIVRIYHGDDAALKAEDAFNKQFRDKQRPEDIPEEIVTKHDWDPVDLLVGLKLADSKSEARRLIEQGGVRHNDDIVDQSELKIKNGDVLQVGKRRFVKLRVN
jgi:tyrosyl-tRNA synthetase